MPRCEPCQPHHWPWGGRDCALAHFRYSCCVAHGNKSTVEFHCSGFPWFTTVNGTFPWCLCLMQLQKLFRVWYYFGLFFFPILLFSTLPVQLSLVQGGCVGQLWDTHGPTLTRIHTSPSGIPEEIYSISQKRDCLVPCQFIISYKCALQLLYQTWGGCPIYSHNRVAERVGCLLLVLSLSEILLTLLICGSCP